jgi:hypothetical protein
MAARDDMFIDPANSQFRLLVFAFENKIGQSHQGAGVF